MSRPRVDALLDELVLEGVRIIEAPLPHGWWGACSSSSRVIYLRRGMSERQALPAVLHEREHWRAGHEGHQPLLVEERIRRLVACQIIDPGDYAAAERLVGNLSGALAVELDTTVPVVDAYQRVLARSA